jgi:hypothetical protein
MLGFNLSLGPKLRKWFEEVGLENIQEEILHIKVGASAPSKEEGKSPIVVLLAALEGIQVNMGSKSTTLRA